MLEATEPAISRRGYYPRRNSALAHIILCILIAVQAAISAPAGALPQFARKYNLPCERCHTMPPRLTPFGYAFYRAGYRLPAGEPKPFTLGNVASFLGEVSARNTNPGGDTGFDVEGVEIHLATALERNLAVRGVYHFGTTSGDSTVFQDLWLQYNSGRVRSNWSLRAGQLPVLDGYQLLGDRSFTLTDPQLFGPNGPLTGADQGNFAIAGLERGVELGYTSGPVSVRGSWLNGVNEAGAGAVPLSGHRASDLALQADYLIGRDGSAIGAFYYLGKTPLLSAGFNDNFQRAGLFGTYARTLRGGSGVAPDLKLEMNGGLLLGRDTISAAGGHARSSGTVLEAALYLRYRTAVAFRYDSALPSGAPGTPITGAYTLALAHRPNNHMRMELEFRNQYHTSANSVIGSVWFFY